MTQPYRTNTHLALDHDGPCNEDCERWCDKWVAAELEHITYQYDAADNRLHGYWHGIPLRRDSDSALAEHEAQTAQAELEFPPRTPEQDQAEELARLRRDATDHQHWVSEMFLVLGSVADPDETMIQTARRLVFAELRRQKPSWRQAPNDL